MAIKTVNRKKSQQREGWFLFGGAALLLLLFFIKLYNALGPQLQKATIALQQNRAIKLEPAFNKDVFKKIIEDGNYFADQRDIGLLADSLSGKLLNGGGLPNLGALNKNAYAIQAPVNWNAGIGGVEFQNRLLASRLRLGFDSVLYNRELTNPEQHPAEVKVASGNGRITGTVLLQGKPMQNVLVQIKQHLPVEVGEDSIPEPVAYARTNNKGEFIFSGLYRDSGYSVLPMKPGYEFGSRQGTSRLNKEVRYAFKAKPHTIRLIGPVVYSQIKEDGVLLVRTPEEFTTGYQLTAGLLIGAFLLVHIILSARKKRPDHFLLPVLLLLCGISVLMMFSIQHPLADTFFAFEVIQGVIAGLIAYTVLCSIDMRKLYTRWWFDALFNYKQKNIYQLKGWTWLVLAILLAVITVLMGTGPEGSGVKVNLQFGGLVFQPGEITKYLLLLFLAGFFAANADLLRNLTDIRWRFYINWAVLTGIAVLLALYLLMGDMGPALVVCFTFLFFYCIARGNLLFTLLSGLTYGGLLWALPGWMATAIAFLLVLIVSLLKGHLRSIKWYGVFALLADAPIIILIVIGSFAFGDRLPGIGERLGDRKAMWLSQWNNDVFGGDHLAHSYWTLASGGIPGQGIGRGFANTMPAAHTDMILPAIGEELGWLGLVAVFLLFGILIHRTFLHARRSGQPFTFYLCAGIGIATGVQLLLIAGGSIGLLPLTGVTVPFLSYGKISLVINLAAMGLVAGISARPGQELQQEYVQKNYDPVLATGISFFLIGIVVLATKLLTVQVFDRKEIVVKQARVVMRNGLPIYSYNPRIDKLMRLLAAGTIYDRNGLLLATSQKKEIQQNLDTLQRAGIDPLQLQELLQKRVRRYYPFAEELFFWTGDYNTRLFWGQQNGYFAEARHLTSLRGFAVSRELQDSVQILYQPNRFTKPYYKTVQLARYDYTALADGLKAGIDSTQAAIRAIREKDRAVRLTVDAALQVEIQDSLHNSSFRDKRISVVVMDAATGDVLASALNPLPDLQSPGLMLLTDREREQLNIPVTDRDLGMTYATAPGSAVKILTALAGLNKMGKAAAELKYTDIYRSEIFRDNIKEQEPFVPKVSFVDMHEAIVNSSNIFFIRLANENYLEEQMAELYQTTGMNLNQVGGYNYTLQPDRRRQSTALASWRKDVLNSDHRQYNNPDYAGKTKRYRSLFSGIAWGQSVLTATPASMARMAGAIANEGIMQPSRYVLQEAGKASLLPAGIQLAHDTSYASILKQYMIDQSSRPGKQKIRNAKVAGKTGTPERMVKGEKQSDGWYVFFAPTPDNISYTVTCIRIETGQSSANAVLLANTVANILQKRNYMGSF